MALISDNYHKQKLDKYGINIKTKYYVGNKICERNTDNSINDDIINGIRCEKNYYVKNRLVHSEKIFDSRIEYTYISKDMENKDYTCNNCGIESKLNDFVDGCPYCKTYYNIDYTDKDLGSKYHYDRVLKSNTYKVVTAIIDLVISLILSFIFIKYTSRTFNSIDVLKVFLYGIILSLILYYLFYIIDGYIILGPIKRYKDKQNQKQINFWNRVKIDKKKFFNNLNYEVRKYYYIKTDIIDFDILDYVEFNDYVKDNIQYINVTAEVIIISYNNGKIKSKIINDKYEFTKNINNTLNLNNETNMIRCNNCGSTIDANKGECDYCHSKINYHQDWILVNNK